MYFLTIPEMFPLYLIALSVCGRPFTIGQVLSLCSGSLASLGFARFARVCSLRSGSRFQVPGFKVQVLCQISIKIRFFDLRLHFSSKPLIYL
jgi:hypothetical protein